MNSFAFAAQALSAEIAPSTWRGVSGETPAGGQVAAHLRAVHSLLAASRDEPTFRVDLLAAFRTARAGGVGDEDTQFVGRELMRALLELHLRGLADVDAWVEKPGRNVDSVLQLVSAAADLARVYGPAKAVTTCGPPDHRVVPGLASARQLAGGGVCRPAAPVRHPGRGRDGSGLRPVPRRRAGRGGAVMAFRRVTCMIAVCDLCGGGEDGDGYTPHFDTDTEAVDYLTDCGWQLLDDGRLLCWRTDRVHEQAREDHGEAKIPDGAMTVTFSDPEPPCDPPPDITGADWHDANPQHAAVTSGGEVTS